jgi:hypothetical protein
MKKVMEVLKKSKEAEEWRYETNHSPLDFSADLHYYKISIHNHFSRQFVVIMFFSDI